MTKHDADQGQPEGFPSTWPGQRPKKLTLMTQWDDDVPVWLASAVLDDWRSDIACSPWLTYIGLLRQTADEIEKAGPVQ